MVADGHVTALGDIGDVQGAAPGDAGENRITVMAVRTIPTGHSSLPPTASMDTFVPESRPGGLHMP